MYMHYLCFACCLECTGQIVLKVCYFCVTSESSNILTKKKIFDVYMSKMRLQEEKIIVMREMRQHCTYLRKLSGNIKTVISEMSSGKNSGKKLTYITFLLECFLGSFKNPLTLRSSSITLWIPCRWI